MSTINEAHNPAAALFGKTRRALLALLYSHPDEEFYLRQMARAVGTGHGATQREVRNLTEAGIIRRRVRGRQIYYQANPECPIFSELRSMIIKTAGIGDVLRTALAPLADRISIAFIYGSIARGKERRGSDVDVLIVGDVTFAEVSTALMRAQEILKREVNPTVYPPAEFKSKLAANHHFLVSVMKDARIFLIGDKHELARLAAKRLAR